MLSSKSHNNGEESSKHDSVIKGSYYESTEKDSNSVGIEKSDANISIVEQLPQHKRKRKRGLKPRSQRNRKKARGGGVGFMNELCSSDNDVEISVIKLFPNENDKMDCIRVVKPYIYTFSTFVKQRWIGKSLLDVYHEEFGSYPRSYYESAILNGQILVSSKQVAPTYILKAGNEITHTVHRHEPAVAVNDFHNDSFSQHSTEFVIGGNNSYGSRPLISILYQDKDIVVVDKPPTVPIHPCGGYNFNSLFHILQAQISDKLFTVHRLDRLTSGLVICAKSSQVAKELGESIMDRKCRKYYLAKVKGKFPLNLTDIPEIYRFEGDGFEASSDTKCNTAVAGDTSSKKLSTEDHKNPFAKKDSSQETLSYWITHNNSDIILDNTTSISDIFSTCPGLDSLENMLPIPWTPQTAIDPNATFSSTASQYSHKYLVLHLACPCRVASPKIGICQAGHFPQNTPNVKHAQTSFTPLSYDSLSDTTIVLCKPITGRTHQIRLHLQFLGHPIANDPCYGGELWYDDDKAKAACHCAKVRMEEMDLRSGQLMTKKDSKPEGAISTDVPATDMEVQRAFAAADETVHSKNHIDSTDKKCLYIKNSCVWCQRSAGETHAHERVMCEFLTRSRGLWLHALQYSFHLFQNARSSNEGVDVDCKTASEMGFRTELPKWCKL